MNSEVRQIPLALDPGPQHRLSDYIAGPNALARQAVKAAASSSDLAWPFLWGAEGTGKTHLLSGCVQAAIAAGRDALYIPGRRLAEQKPAYLESLEGFALLALDDIDAVVGTASWDLALFGLYNRIKDSGGVLVTAAQTSLAQLEPSLPDLRSRLRWGSAFNLTALDDEDKIQVLTDRGETLGYEVTQEVSRYLMRHYSRNLKSMVSLLNELETATLVHKRRLTVAFLKSYLTDKQDRDS